MISSNRPYSIAAFLQTRTLHIIKCHERKPEEKERRYGKKRSEKGKERDNAKSTKKSFTNLQTDVGPEDKNQIQFEKNESL